MMRVLFPSDLSDAAASSTKVQVNRRTSQGLVSHASPRAPRSKTTRRGPPDLPEASLTHGRRRQWVMRKRWLRRPTGLGCVRRRVALPPVL
ncbi:hypothetical protein GW17_00006787 [Ensete ventricosum]|nr:hypothetical protein GW17_00006787 [Ensete ventricosum]